MTSTATISGTGRDTGSFRDPSGYVFQRDGRIYRAIDDACHETLRALEKAGLLGRLMDEGLVVKTRFVEEQELLEELAAEQEGYRHFLEHDCLPFISYPYEWSVSMVADAGVLTLDLQVRLLEAGFSLKDATAYNVQFHNGRPIFIDLSSIERPARLDIWIALGQFQQMFTYPLLLVRLRGWDLRSYFLANLGGRTAEQVSRAFGWLERWRPALLLDLTLPLLLNRKADGKKVNGQEILKKVNANPSAQILNLKRLRGKLTKLGSRYPTQGIWTRYVSDCDYSTEAEEAKKKLVKEFLKEIQPRTVLDLGCNTGDYSILAADCGARVLAVDGDHDAIELLFRRLRARPTSITPLWVDLTNPSPAIGFRNQERKCFLDRVQADCVLALALLHHLLVSGNLALSDIRDLLYDQTDNALILEFVPTHDPMFQRLRRFRLDNFESLTLNSCLEVFQERFQVIRQEALPGTGRKLLFFRKNSDRALSN